VSGKCPANQQKIPTPSLYYVMMALALPFYNTRHSQSPKNLSSRRRPGAHHVYVWHIQRLSILCLERCANSLLQCSPSNNILSIPFRRSLQVSLSTTIRQYINTKYDQHPDMFQHDLEMIDALRRDATNVREPHLSGIKKLQVYAGQLVWIGGKFPIDVRHNRYANCFFLVKHGTERGRDEGKILCCAML
jgi:hypothetical protein